MALLINPANALLVETKLSDFLPAAQACGVELRVLNASTERDFDAAFAKLIPLRAGGLAIGTDAFFNSWSEQLAALMVHSAVPAVYRGREFAVAEGRLGYGASLAETGSLASIPAGLSGSTDPPIRRSSSPRRWS